MPRPHPIIRIPTELADRGRRCKHQPHIVEIAVNGEPELIASIISIYHAKQSGVFQGYLTAYYHHHRVYRTGTFHLVHRRFNDSQHTFGYIFRTKQKTNVKLRIRQFLCTATGYETIFQVIMLHRRMLLHTAEAAVMIGKHQPVFRHYHTGTKPSKADYRIFQRRFLRII